MTLLSLSLYTPFVAVIYRGISQKLEVSFITRIEWQAVHPDEMAHYDEPSHLDLHCCARYLFWSSGLKGLMKMNILLHKKEIIQADGNSVSEYLCVFCMTDIIFKCNLLLVYNG